MGKKSEKKHNSSPSQVKSSEVFDYDDYKEYLQGLAGPTGTRNGLRLKFADALNCNPGYISKIFNHTADFSLEQAEILNTILNHSTEESHFFLLLVQKARAGTFTLKKYYDQQLIKIKNDRLNLSRRIEGTSDLAETVTKIYYSHWHYSAIHVALSVPELRGPEKISHFFGISIGRVKEILKFLVINNFAIENLGSFQIGRRHLHLSNSSPHISQHHTNWRSKSLNIHSWNKPNDVHYTAAVSLSREDVEILNNLIVKHIEKVNQILKPSKEEVVYCFQTDFFSLEN